MLVNKDSIYIHFLLRAVSLKQCAATATASSESILKATHVIAIFNGKMAVVSKKYLENTDRLGGSSILPLLVSLYYFRLTNIIFLLNIHVLLAALAVAVASSV